MQLITAMGYRSPKTKYFIFDHNFRKHKMVFGRPFLRRFALSYRTVVCLSLTLCIVAKRLVWRYASAQATLLLDEDLTQLPQFSAHVCCGQTAGWIKMPLGTEVGPGPSTLC